MGLGILGLMAILIVFANKNPTPTIIENSNASEILFKFNEYIKMEQARVITNEHIAGPIIKIGFLGNISFPFPKDTLYCLLKNRVNHKAPRIKYATKANNTPIQFRVDN